MNQKYNAQWLILMFVILNSFSLILKQEMSAYVNPAKISS